MQNSTIQHQYNILLSTLIAYIVYIAYKKCMESRDDLDLNHGTLQLPLISNDILVRKEKNTYKHA